MKGLANTFCNIGYIALAVALICFYKSNMVGFYVSAVVMAICAVGMIVSLRKGIRNEK